LSWILRVWREFFRFCMNLVWARPRADLELWHLLIDPNHVLCWGDDNFLSESWPACQQSHTVCYSQGDAWMCLPLCAHHTQGNRFPGKSKFKDHMKLMHGCFEQISEAYTCLRSVSFPLQHVCFSVFASHLLLAIAGWCKMWIFIMILSSWTIYLSSILGCESPSKLMPKCPSVEWEKRSSFSCPTHFPMSMRWLYKFSSQSGQDSLSFGINSWIGLLM